MQNESLERVPDAELHYTEKLVYTRAGAPFTGIAFDENPAGIRSEISYRGGLQDGVARDWWPSGRLKGESHFRENVLHGPVREYNETGVVIVDNKYEYGILVERTFRNEDDQVVETYQIDPTASTYSLLERWRHEKGWPV